MAQFDVYENTNPKTRKAIPYLLDVQTDLLNILATRVVVPLITVSAMEKGATHLNPSFRIKRTTFLMSTAELAGVHKNLLGAKVCSLGEQRDEIIAALDFLFTGF